MTGYLADLFASFADKFHIVKKQLRRISAALQEDDSGQAVDLSEIDVDAFMGWSESAAEENVCFALNCGCPSRIHLFCLAQEEPVVDRYRNKLNSKTG